MQLQVGMVLEGKVTGITKFGAFVALPDGKSGLVHISEIANTFVNDVHDYVQDGQEVKVKVIGIADDGKINLSIKKAEAPEQPPRQSRPARPYAGQQQQRSGNYNSYRQSVPRATDPLTTPALKISSSTSCRSPTAAWRTTRCTPTIAPEGAADKLIKRRAASLCSAPLFYASGRSCGFCINIVPAAFKRRAFLFYSLIFSASRAFSSDASALSSSRRRTGGRGGAGAAACRRRRRSGCCCAGGAEGSR